MGPMRRLGLLLGFVTLLTPSLALAASQEWDGGYQTKAQRRSGLAASVGLGIGFGDASGYPNDVGKQYDPAYQSSIDAGLGSAWSLWVGGALRDWFTFGVGMSSFGAGSGNLKAAGGAFILHVEGFPAWSLGGPWRDLSTFADFGAGGVSITGGREKTDGGLMSVVGGGVSYELFRFGHFALGPMLSSNYLYSETSHAFGVFGGIRSTFYGGP